MARFSARAASRLPRMWSVRDGLYSLDMQRRRSGPTLRLRLLGDLGQEGGGGKVGPAGGSVSPVAKLLGR